MTEKTNNPTPAAQSANPASFGNTGINICKVISAQVEAGNVDPKILDLAGKCIEGAQKEAELAATTCRYTTIRRGAPAHIGVTASPSGNITNGIDGQHSSAGGTGQLSVFFPIGNRKTEETTFVGTGGACFPSATPDTPTGNPFGNYQHANNQRPTSSPDGPDGQATTVKASDLGNLPAQPASSQIPESKASAGQSRF